MNYLFSNTKAFVFLRYNPISPNPEKIDEKVITIGKYVLCINTQISVAVSPPIIKAKINPIIEILPAKRHKVIPMPKIVKIISLIFFIKQPPSLNA